MAVLTKAELLSTLDRLFPVGYLDPIKDPGPGYELFKAAAAVGERVSTAVQRTEDGGLFLVAAGGSTATVLLSFTRSNGGAGNQTVKAGTLVIAPSGAAYRLNQDVQFVGAATTGAPNPIEATAVAPGWSFNEPGPFAAADGTLVAGPIDTISLRILDPAFTAGAAPIEVTQVGPAAGGADQALDRLGLDRGLPRASGESDAAYRSRLRLLPDTVSPEAINRALASLLTPLGVTYSLIETFSLSYQTCWDAPDATFPPLPSVGVYDQTCFVFDDPRSPLPFRGRWLDAGDQRCAFIVVVSTIASMKQCSIGYDDTALTQADLLSPIGRRATGAFDLTGADPGVMLDGALDGTLYNGLDPDAAAVYKGLLELLLRIKAGGVQVSIVLAGE